MINDQLPVIFDGHNDLLLRLHFSSHENPHLQFLKGDGEGHLDLPRMRQGGFGGGFFAIYIPSDLKLDDLIAEMSKPQYDVPLPPEIPYTQALPIALSMAADLIRIEALSEGHAKICKSSSELRACLEAGIIAMVMHMEGAEAIGEDFDGLEVLYQAGLRSLGPVWSRPTRFGHGVPFRFPASPDTGPGLTKAGKELLRLCNTKKILFDLAHLNEAGFWDVAKISDAPLIATHSNAHSVCPHTRNLTDNQLSAIRDSGGVVGLNFATSATRRDGQSLPDMPITDMLRHLDHLIAILGIEGVALGSDFDGATISNEIKDVSGLTNLRKSMRSHGFDKDTMRLLCHDNWLNVLQRTWGE